jgi:hypothetical protein
VINNKISNKGAESLSISTIFIRYIIWCSFNSRLRCESRIDLVILPFKKQNLERNCFYKNKNSKFSIHIALLNYLVNLFKSELCFEFIFLLFILEYDSFCFLIFLKYICFKNIKLIFFNYFDVLISNIKINQFNIFLDKNHF